MGRTAVSATDIMARRIISLWTLITVTSLPMYRDRRSFSFSSASFSNQALTVLLSCVPV
jgi:hypothetical protein